MSNQPERFDWWNQLRHGGLLLDPPRLSALITHDPEPLSYYDEDRLRRRVASFDANEGAERSNFVHFVLEAICGFRNPRGHWLRGSEVDREWSRKAITGEVIRPQQLWIGPSGSLLPVFLDSEKRIGVGRGKRVVGHALQWLRQGDQRLALVTNGYDWRLVYAGLDYEAFCEWHLSQFFSEGDPSPEFNGLRSLFAPPLWTCPADGEPCPLLAAINDSRKGQAELSQVLGERVRRAVEQLIQGHASVLNEHRDSVDPRDVYHAGVRIVMRMVVVLFAESRDGLLPLDNPIYHDGYSLTGLREQLGRRSSYRLKNSFAAYPRLMALFKLVCEGSSHEAMLVPAYGGELFGPGDSESSDGMLRALALFEQSCFERELMPDVVVKEILELLSRTKVKIRQGRSSTWMPAAVDFSSLDSEYIGILYEGLLDFELRTAPEGDPIVFLAVGNQPALPLATLEGMDDKALKNLLEKMKDTSSSDDEEEESGEEAEDTSDAVEDSEPEDTSEEDEALLEAETEDSETDEVALDDVRHTTRARAEAWALRACEVGKLVRKPTGKKTPEKKLKFEADLDRKAKQIVPRVVLPGEWYLVRWGGTRKGSGTFYTRPQLAVPTVHRTLRPLAYDPPVADGGEPNVDAPLEAWKPKRPEEILALKVCDPACGSGSFPLAALRFLTDALFNALVVHKRFEDDVDRTIIDLIEDKDFSGPLGGEVLPCRSDDPEFEIRTKAVLRRYVVERCIHGVDIDPLAVELCRLSLWIETLDRRLPFTFLDHKIKCGNSLVGAWFDQFMHYPVMAWSREGGDKSHSGGVHYAKDAWGKAIKERAKLVKSDLIKFIDGAKLVYKVDLSTVQTVHDQAEKAFREIHALGIHETERRAARYHELRASEEFLKLKDAFDLWCALWFWPPEQIELAPLPSEHAEDALSDIARNLARQVARERRFFHWELEFPDVFSDHSPGFDAVLGNPPWETLQPNSKEFFSAIDPLYRAYGKQEALAKQREYFTRDCAIERAWLEYNAGFKSIAEWMKYAGYPFGNRVTEDKNGKLAFDCNLGSGGPTSFETATRRHETWEQKREESSGYADAQHAFRYQGNGKAYTYKLFSELAFALLKERGRLGLILPSGIYSDDGSDQLRQRFFFHGKWDWLFGLYNTQISGGKIFDIHPSYKFNPAIVEKGGKTKIIRAAFMRRDLSDWEHAEKFAAAYDFAYVQRFSPQTMAVLEIQSAQEMAAMVAIYSNSVLLADQTSSSWQIRFRQGDFNMTSDSRLFPPRSKWEEWGYQPDEYSRWIKGPWKTIPTLWQKLGFEVDKIEISADDTSTDGSMRVSRVDIPPGIILSRDADAWIDDASIPIDTFRDARGLELNMPSNLKDGETATRPIEGKAMALPLYQGIMMNQLISNRAQFGIDRPTKWSLLSEFSSSLVPKYAMGLEVAEQHNRACLKPKCLVRTIARTTDTRTIIGTPACGLPAGNSVAVLNANASQLDVWALGGIMSSLVYDWQMRRRIAGTNVNKCFVMESAVPRREALSSRLALLASSVSSPSWLVADQWLRIRNEIPTIAATAVKALWAICSARRTEMLAMLEAATAILYGVDEDIYRLILEDCDWPLEHLIKGGRSLNPVGFWRVDKKKYPEHRHTILSLVAFRDLQEKINECGGDTAAGIEAFCNQNDGQGWMLPETLRLADYGLGHDDRAQEHQPVRECFGPRFYDWQLAQTPEESWRECHLHARNLLGEAGYQRLIDEIEGRGGEDGKDDDDKDDDDKNDRASTDGKLFEKEHLPLFDR